MKIKSKATWLAYVVTLLFSIRLSAGSASENPATIFGFRAPAAELAVENRFLQVPSAKLAEDHLRILTHAPHIAGSPEDKATADYVAQKFREAGLETEIAEYRVWINYPAEVSVDLVAPAGVKMHGPTREHVEGDPFQANPGIVTAFNGMSPSGDVEAEVVYANYGRPEDFRTLEQMKIDVRGKIILVRYGENFRGVKVLLAQEHGAAAVIIYSDPADDGWKRGDKYPIGPWRPDKGVQRGSVGYMFEFAGDPTTPGIASIPTLPDSKRTPPAHSAAMPTIPATPISYSDAWPILQNLSGPESPRDWQGALPFTYHLGPGTSRIKLHLKQDYQYRTIWNVTGRLRGSDSPEQWVLAGNHRDAWVFGAVDPNSGTAAMLEAVHGIGDLAKSGWRPKRTLVFGSWDAEEYGLIGSTEWAEQHQSELVNAAAYFNMDVAVSGPKFSAAAVPSLKQFVRDVSKLVPAAKGGTLYESWQKSSQPADSEKRDSIGSNFAAPAAATKDVSVGDLGSGSDYTGFLQHLGVPSADAGSTGSYGVYHSAFDNFNWFKKFADPDFTYEQQMARFFGLEVIRMADADFLPYDYEEYGKEIGVYIDAAKKKAVAEFGQSSPDFAEALQAAHRLEDQGGRTKSSTEQQSLTANSTRLNETLMKTERALLIPEGLPKRPWYRHSIYAPGKYTGYAAVVIPGVNEAIDKHDAEATRQQLAALTAALDRATQVLSGYHP